VTSTDQRNFVDTPIKSRPKWNDPQKSAIVRDNALDTVASQTVGGGIGLDRKSAGFEGRKCNRYRYGRRTNRTRIQPLPCYTRVIRRLSESIRTKVDGKGRALVVVTYRFASSIATCTRTRGDINCYLKHEARVPKKVPLVSSGVHSQRVYVLKQSCNELFILE